MDLPQERREVSSLRAFSLGSWRAARGVCKRLLFGHGAAVSVRRLGDTELGRMGSCSSVCLCGSVLGAHRHQGRRRYPWRAQHCLSAAAGCAARLLGHHTCGFPPALLRRVLKRENFDQSCLSNSA